MADKSRSIDPGDLKDAFRQAAAIAAVVPEAMQEAAFHRALDQVLGSGDEKQGSTRTQRDRSRGGGARTQASAEKQTVPGSAIRLIEEINRTDYPEIASSTKALDRALAVLRLAKRDFAIDGLTAPEIATVLTDKFRQRTSRQAVAQALGSAHTMVDTRARGRTTVYRIMQAGEDHLERDPSEDQRSKRPAAASNHRRRKTPRGRAGATTSREPKKSRDNGATARKARRRGPKTAVGDLIDEGFFSQARTINDAQEQLRHKKGLRFSLQDLSPSLVRLLREGRLDRDRNASGQYEYRDA